MTAAPAESPAVFVNDEPRPLGRDASLLGIVRDLGLADRKGVAVAVNGSVVPRARWPEALLQENDRVLVIRATQGG